MACNKCPLRGQPKVPTSRGTEPVLVIGEAPGRIEAYEGVPFVGDSGRFAREHLPVLATATITNAVLCHPPKNKVQAAAVKCCNAHVKVLVQQFDIIFILGAVALHAVFEGRKVFKDVKGSSFVEGGKTFYVLAHPSSVLYRPDQRASVVEQYAAAYAAYRAGGGVELEELEPQYSDPPDGFMTTASDEVRVLDCEWNGRGDVLIGILMEDGGVWQHTRSYALPKFPPEPGELISEEAKEHYKRMRDE